MESGVSAGRRFVARLARAAAVGLALGCLTLLYSVSTGPLGLVRLTGLLPVLGANVLLLTAAQLVLVLLLSPILSRRPKASQAQDSSSEWGAAGFLATALLLLDMSGLLRTSPRDGPASLGAWLQATLVGVVILIVASLVAAQVRRPQRWPAFLRRGMSSVPVALCELLLATWAARYVVARGAALSTGLVLLGGLVVATATFLVWPRLAARLRQGLVTSLFCVAVAWPFGQPLAETALARARENAAPLARPSVPTVVLITIDALRADHLGSYAPDASRPSRTPHLDRLAERSVRFTRAYAPSCWTEPSVATLMTGLSPAAHGIAGSPGRLSARLATLAEVLQERGYLTAANISNPLLARPLGFDQGFGEYVAWPLPDLGNTLGGRLLARLEETGCTTEMQARWAARWITRHRERAFFLWLHIYDPHQPYAPPREYLRWVENWEQYGAGFGWVGQARVGTLALDQAKRRWISALYGAEVRYVDDSVALVLEALEQADLFDDALVVVTNDHGEELWDHGSIGHGHAMHEELVRAPLIVKLPQSTHGRVVEQRVSTASLAPTILDLCGLPRGSLMTNAPSLAPLLAGQTVAERPAFISGRLFYGPEEVVLFDRWKYTVSPNEAEERLYDIDRDPGERESLAASHPEALERARRLLAEHRRRAEMAVARVGREDVLDLDEETREALRQLGYIH